MTNTEATTSLTDSLTNPPAETPPGTLPGALPGSLPDPRPDLATVVATVRSIIGGIDDRQLGAATPCDEFDVHDLLDHVDLVFRRVAALGNGEHWSSVDQVRVGSTVDDYVAAVADGAHAMMSAWTDTSKLDQVLELPWTSLPAAAALFTYVGEVAIHSWDLATATGQSVTIDDSALTGALVAWQQLPAEGRNTLELPFSDVVDPGPDAPTLLRLAGWAGRQVV